MTRKLWMAAVLALALGGLTPAGAAAAPPAAGTGCQEQQAFVEGDPDAVDASLPDGYAPVRSPASGRPIVFARGLRCADIALGATSGPATFASYGVVVESPDGRGCGSAAPGAGGVKGDVPPVCNWYVLAWLASDRRTVDWLRSGTPGFRALHVPDLVFELGESAPPAGAPFAFRAGGPSPFAIEMVAHEGAREISVRGGYWAETAQGTVKIALSSDDLRAGDASGTVRAAPGSKLARLMGATERPLATGFSAFATVRAAHGVYRKQVLPPPGSSAGLSGSCSVEGTVHFDPPAKNDPQPLGYTYAGEGTCTGTLNGRRLDAEPVRMRHAGRSHGGCESAKTVSPGSGSMTLASGEVVRYTLDFTTTGTEVSGTMYGERSGAAPGRGSFVTARSNAVEVVRQCGGDGVVDTPLDLSFTTHSPLVNEPPAKARRGLRLTVSPRTVEPGRRTAFAMRVTTSDRRPVAGASVRFFGRRVRTDAGGRATIVATLHGAGAHPVTANREGFRGARAAVRVRRR
jgi:hypothetical protein